MSKRRRLVFLLVSLAILTFAIEIKAETLTATVPLTPGAEVNPNPPAPANATGYTNLTVEVNRDGAGNIVGGVVTFQTFFNFPPGPVTITGHHIHEGSATANGPVVINPSLNVPTVFPNGSGMVTIQATGFDLAVFRRLIANPSRFYVNLHTNFNPAGAIRGQLTRFTERIGATVFMDPMNEVPPIPTLAASGRGTITIDVTRDALGQVTGGNMVFTVFYVFPGEVQITGLHIHEERAGVNGPIRFDTRISGTNRVISPTGRGVINLPVAINTPAAVQDLRELLADPTGFYVNLHTAVPPHPGGAIRAQLPPFGTSAQSFAASPSLSRSSKYVLTAGGEAETIELTSSAIDDGSGILVNDELVVSDFDPATGRLTATIPAHLLATPGTLAVQARRSDGPRSTPLFIVVANASNLNTVPAATVDSARYAPRVAPESLATIFGDDLATAVASGGTIPLPTTLDGSTVLFNGAEAGLFYVSDPQINLQVTPYTLPGQVDVVVVNRNGKVSQGKATVEQVAPAVFTSNSMGTGAAVGLASTDGVNFNTALGNVNGTTNAIAAGSFVQLYTTGIRFASATPSITIGGTAVTPTFVGPHGTFIGSDQINFVVPASLAGRGEVDLVVTVDGKTSNTVRIRIQ